VPIVHAVAGLTVWAGILGLHGVWERYCLRHPRVADRLLPPEPNWIGDEAEEWLRRQDRPAGQ
jgi:hypothetical protein